MYTFITYRFFVLSMSAGLPKHVQHWGYILIILLIFRDFWILRWWQVKGEKLFHQWTTVNHWPLGVLDEFRLIFAKFLQIHGDLSQIGCRRRFFFELCTQNAHFVAKFATNCSTWCDIISGDIVWKLLGWSGQIIGVIYYPQ